MQKIDITVPEDIQRYVAVLQDVLGPSYTVCLAGGCLRDTLGGVKWKDLDILVAPSSDAVAEVVEGYITEDVEKRVFDACIPDWFITQDIINCDYIADMKHRGVAGLIRGEVPNIDNAETQLIIYGKAMTPAAMMVDMDMNINQVVMGADGVVYGSEAFVHGMHYGYIKILNHYDPIRELSRIARMRTKYPHFNVEVA